jgi:hypothetical protein
MAETAKRENSDGTENYAGGQRALAAPEHLRRELVRLFEHGGRVIKVDPENNSRTCAECGAMFLEHDPARATRTCENLHVPDVDANNCQNQLIKAGLRGGGGDGDGEGKSGKPDKAKKKRSAASLRGSQSHAPKSQTVSITTASASNLANWPAHGGAS